MQITRQRVRPAVKINTSEKCPTCAGSGKINASILLMENIERDLQFILQSRPNSKIRLKTHPYATAYLKKGLPSIQMRWLRKYYKWIKIEEENNFHLNQYKFFDGNNDEIRFN